jgi:(R,R)-butanediol dehydrogenase / meso-butanediol dehydrogenase / diacetyl reductase
MKALVFYDVHDVRLEKVKETLLGPNKVKIKVAWAGICGSDLHKYHFGFGMKVTEPHPLTGQMAPLILGHEFSGVVAEVGGNVKDIKVGDRVTVEPIFMCKNCESCKSGKYNHCELNGFIGSNADGGFAEYVMVEDYMVHKLPDNLSFEEGALIEPTAVALQAVKNSSIKAGDTVAVYGVGPIGLLTILSLKAVGAKNIIAIDISPERLNKAQEVGATHSINSMEQVPSEFILEQFGGNDIAFEAAGVQETLTDAIKSVKKGGEIAVISIFSKPVEIDVTALVMREINLSTSFVYRDMFPRVIDMISLGELDVMKVVTDKIDLDHIIEDGFERLSQDKSQAKILVEIR